MPRLTVQPVRIASSSEDESGVLVFIEGRLAAVLSLLEASYHREAQGRWFLEAGFGRCAVSPPAPHARLRDALRWIADQMNLGATVCETELDEIEHSVRASAGAH